MRLAERLAEVVGKPVPDIVREAIAEKAKAIGVEIREAAKFNPAEKLRRMIEISDRIARLPVLDPRTPDEIVGYDDLGLPR